MYLTEPPEDGIPCVECGRHEATWTDGLCDTCAQHVDDEALMPVNEWDARLAEAEDDRCDRDRWV
jgi:hypothetical protein